METITATASTAPSPAALTDQVEYQEVPEGRTIQGHNLHFHGPVYGQALSDGGTISFKDAFGWGKAVSPAGRITAERRAFNATLQAPGGVVVAKSAQSCLIIGREVRVQEAVNCQIFAHTLQLGTASGCMIAGRSLEIQTAKPYKAEPNTITIVVPELPDLREVLEPMAHELARLEAQEEALGARIAAHKADAALTQYLAIRAKVRTGLANLTADQAQGYQQMESRLAEPARALEVAVAERRAANKALVALRGEIQALRDQQTARMADCHCTIRHVSGETIVRQLLEAHDDPDLSLIAPPMIPKILFRNDASVRFLFAPHDGAVHWTPDMQEAPC